MKMCVLVDDKICDNCGECNVCDLDPNKICDNCMKCLNSGADYNAIEVDEIIDEGLDEFTNDQLREDLATTGAEEPFECFRPKQYRPKSVSKPS